MTLVWGMDVLDKAYVRFAEFPASNIGWICNLWRPCSEAKAEYVVSRSLDDSWGQLTIRPAFLSGSVLFKGPIFIHVYTRFLPARTGWGTILPSISPCRIFMSGRGKKWLWGRLTCFDWNNAHVFYELMFASFSHLPPQRSSIYFDFECCFFFLILV